MNRPINVPTVDDGEGSAAMTAAGKTIVVRDPAPLAPGDFSAYAEPAERLLELVGTPSFETVKAYFSDYPANGLSTPTARSLMFHMVRAMRPELVIEIGTFHGAMTEVVARALWENGGGNIVTIDPFGNDRVPDLLTAWPAALGRHVSYANFTSMDLYIDFENIRRRFDLGFIDGNHNYEFAYYDLISLAKWIRPGGILIVDDYNQPSVFWAVKHFLQLYPDWRELGGAMADWRLSDPFGSVRDSVKGSSFLILAAPQFPVLRQRPVGFETSKFFEPGLSGYALRLAPGNARGVLHAMVFLRSFPREANGLIQEQLVAETKVALDADMARCSIDLPQPLRTSHDPALSYRTAEIVLGWECADGDLPLQLQDEPQPILMNEPTGC